MKGFRNIGNTCYLNSGLQMLVQNKDLCQLIIKYSSESTVLEKIADFINNYYNDTNTNIIVPKEIKKIVFHREKQAKKQAKIDTRNNKIKLAEKIKELKLH